MRRSIVGAAAVALAAALPALPAQAGYYSCGAQVTANSSCPNGEPAMFHAGEPPAPGPAQRGRSSPAAEGAAPIAAGPPLCSDPAAFAYKPGHYTCEGRPTSASTCPNGEPAVYHDELVQACQATPVRHVSREEMARMDKNLDARAREIARQWTRSGRLNAAQIRAIRTGNCLIMGAANPDVTCVLGTPF
jgi:hypothetical protein